MALKRKRSLKEKKNSQEAELKEDDCSPEATSKLQTEVKESEPHVSASAQVSEAPPSDSEQPTVTTTDSKQRKSGGLRSICSMHKLVVKKAKGKKCKVTCDEFGVPTGDSRKILQSYIGMLARTMVPIDLTSWPKVDSDLKEKIWLDVQDTFNISAQLENFVLKSAGRKWRQFKADLTRKFVLPLVGQKKKLGRPPKQYGFVGKSTWKRFVEQRTCSDWQTIHEKQCARVGKRKYHHRLSRKGYIGLREEEIKAGKLAVNEVVDRAIFWKKAREGKPGMVVDEELAKMNQKIDTLLEQKRQGEFCPSGSKDVLTTALETPEHSGMVRAVGSFVTPKLYFNLPRERKVQITKAELLARDRQRSDELEKVKQDMRSEIEQLKAMISAGASIQSPILSDKSSFQPLGNRAEKLKPVPAEGLLPDDVEECIATDDTPHPPPLLKKKGARKCDLSVGSIDTKVAFGVVFPLGDDKNKKIHGRDMPPGCLRVSVDGLINPDALLPVPVPGEMEVVHEALGSHVAWPESLISFPKPVIKKKEFPPSNKSESQNLRKLQTMYSLVKPPNIVPKRWRLLYKHAMTLMKDGGDSIQIPCDEVVFGYEKIIYVLHENVLALLKFEMVGQGVLAAYMMHLYTEIRETKEWDTFGFFDPGLTFNLNEEFESYAVKRLREGNDRIYFMPHNSNMHWILSIIWDGDIYILNPLSHPNHFPALEKALTGAVKSFNIETGRGNKMPKVKHLLGCPKQPGGHECGYVVMRYMKDIIADKEFTFLKKWSAKNRSSYSMEDLEEVRHSALGYIEEHM